MYSGRVQSGWLMRDRVVRHNWVTAEQLLLWHLINDGREELVFQDVRH